MSNTDLLQPQAVDLEEVIIGACLLDKNAYLIVADLLSPETFYKEAHSILWEAMQLSFNEGNPIDVVTITHAVRKMGRLEEAGGAYNITLLTGKVASSANIQHHAMLIKQLWMLRELIATGGRLMRNAYETGADPFELMNHVTNSIDAISLSIEKTKEVPLKTQLKNTIKEIEESAKAGHTVGKSTGFKSIDKLGGLVKTDLIILAARPGQGKSALGVQIAINVSTLYDEPVLIFEMEMHHRQLWKREISRQTGILHKNVRKGLISDEEWSAVNKVVGDLSKRKIEIYDFPRQPLSYMRRKIMAAKTKYGDIGLVVIDFLQLAETDEIRKNGSREQEVSKISRGLKVFAKEFDVPVLAIASLSRETEKRAGKEPMMSDLRESGSIESDADKIWLLHRPELYGITELDDGTSTKNLVKLIQPKNRSGDTGYTTDLRFSGETVSFSDVSNEIEFDEPEPELPLPF